MTKDDKKKIADAFTAYSSAATQCSNVLYNLSQRGIPEAADYGRLVRNHDASRNALSEVLKRFGLKAAQ